MKLRKRKLPRVVWAVVDRYDRGQVFDLYPTRRRALAAARYDIRHGYHINGRLSVVRLLVDAETEVVL